MFGPGIITRSISATSIPDKFGNRWQYHSQSDRHSKVTCWAILFDLLVDCPLLRQHVAERKVGFGINHEMRDFQTNRKKDLDLVVCTPGPTERLRKPPRSTKTFAEMGEAFGVILSSKEEIALSDLPHLDVVTVGSVNLALEAKAAMTEHVKALPRLHDELDSSHTTVHGHACHAIACAAVVINLADEFRSPNRNKFDISNAPPVVNKHNQPNATVRTIEKVREIRRRSGAHQHGFDAIGIVVISLKNDGSPCFVLTTTPAPAPSDVDHYDQMIRRISSLYASQFTAL